LLATQEKDQMKLNSGRLSLIAIVMGGISACASNQIKSGLPLDLRTPGAIAISVEADEPASVEDSVKQQVGKNLAQWSYPIAPEATLPVSHAMTVHIGAPEHGSTPAGFSFSMGNSDPRALEFQKAEVVPITCRLSAVNKPEASAELAMGFSDSAITGAHPDPDELADHASTVCFNLLKEVNWPVKIRPDENKPGTNSWMPEIRIEQEEAVTDTTAKPTTDAPTEPSAVSEPTAQPEPEAKPVTKEINKEGRKVYIIHNQGNPITFKFGHERK
jgi:hypothetical protein